MFRKPLARLLLCVGLSGSYRAFILQLQGGVCKNNCNSVIKLINGVIKLLKSVLQIKGLRRNQDAMKKQQLVLSLLYDSSAGNKRVGTFTTTCNPCS